MDTTEYPMTGRTLYYGEGNNNLRTILSPAAYAQLEEMYARAAAGESWHDIHANTSYPTGIYVFCSVAEWENDPELAQRATGSFEDMNVWVTYFTAAGGTMARSDLGNTVPLSNQFFRSYPKEEQGLDALYPRSDTEVCTVFGITPEMLPQRPAFAEVG